MRNNFYSLVAVLFVLVCGGSRLSAQSATARTLTYPRLVQQFYESRHQQLFWFSQSPASAQMRALLLQRLDSSVLIGTDRETYHFEQLAQMTPGRDSLTLLRQDMQFTDAAIAYCKDLYQGNGMNKRLSYDEWSAKYETRDNDSIIIHLSAANSAGELAAFINTLEPADKEYLAYKAALNEQYTLDSAARAKELVLAMNCYRWIHHFHFEKFIVVNIASATLRYYAGDTLALFSRMIVGKPSTRTPRFSASCTQVILYPYWNVPHSIVVKELFRKYRKKPSLANRDNMQLIDSRGNVVSPDAINWSRYSAGNFPYRIRQSTGCDNSLGVIKFDLNSPFDVYIHDTNTKGLFKLPKRYRSHGCMRVEKAEELGNYLLNNQLDTTFLQAYVKGEKPTPMSLAKPVPVFVVYMTAEAPDGTLTYFADVYHLLGL